MRIALINNFVDDKFNQFFNKYGIDYLKSFHAPQKNLPEIKDFDYFILSGSEYSILNDDPWIDNEMEYVRLLYKQGKKVLGICFGHHLIARAVLGKNAVRQTDYKEFGWFTVTKTKDARDYYLFEGLPNQFTAFIFHFEEVCNLDERFVGLASSKSCEIQAFALKDAPMFGIQFHPEIENPVAHSFLFEMHTLQPDKYPWPVQCGENYRMDFSLLPCNKVFTNFFSLP